VAMRPSKQAISADGGVAAVRGPDYGLLYTRKSSSGSDAALCAIRGAPVSLLPPNEEIRLRVPRQSTIVAEQ
jgi:hypothetical protein